MVNLDNNICIELLEEEMKKSNSFILRDILIFIKKCLLFDFKIEIKVKLNKIILEVEKEIKSSDNITLEDVCNKLTLYKTIFKDEKESMAWSIHEDGVIIWFEKEIGDFKKPYLYYKE